KEQADERLGYRRDDGGATLGRLQQTARRQDRVPRSTPQSEHRSYYNAQDIEILDERKTAAIVGWLQGLVGTSPSKKHRPPTIPKSNLTEIDISKAYTGAFMRIRSIPVFNEFDTRQSYKPEEPMNNMCLYIVDANSF
ncbi:MAG: hypothetical protein ACKPKO_10615, partial [Candidatus Fonsibacter sp.]